MYCGIHSRNGFKQGILMPNCITTSFKGLSVLTIFSLSACATVDVSAIGAVEETLVVEASVERGNVITRTVKRLYQVFTDKGWYEDTSRKRVQSAANILLNGLQTSDDGVIMPVEGEAVNTADLIDDIKTVRYHVAQTTKAAEVYLDVASSDASLNEELKQLQKALRVSEQVHANFMQNSSLNTEASAQLQILQQDVQDLRLVTDDFGDVVRARHIAAKSASAS